jgi:hypothetical protein
LDNNIDDGEYHFVGDTPGVPKANRDIQITTKGQTVNLDVWFTNSLGDGIMQDAASSTTNLGAIPLAWSSSDGKIATVSPAGLVTPLKDGTVVITVKVSDKKFYAGTAPARKVTINFDGQEGEHVSKVTIIDTDGNVMSHGVADAKIFTTENEFFNYYALITWQNADGKTTKTEDTRKDKVTSTITWSVGGSQLPGTINKKTGRLKTGTESGNAYVICEVTGGLGGATIQDTADFQLNTGTFNDNHQDSLTIKICYQEFPDEIVQEKTYTYKQLQGLLKSYTHNYTVIKNSTGYGVLRAKGFLFKDVMELEGVVLEEVYQFRFGTADGYDNPMTYKHLFDSGNRYYFPNWDISNKSQAEVVPPMLATESNLVWDKSEADPTQPLSENTRFRLAFGPLWSMDSNSSFQIYYIHTINVVLAGAPPVDPGDGNGDDNGGGGDGDDGGTAAGTGSGGDDNLDLDADGGGLGDDELTEDTTAASAALAASRDSHGWRVYEMMSAAKSKVAALELDNPLAPYALPAAAASVLAGAGFTLFGYIRRRQDLPAFENWRTH